MQHKVHVATTHFTLVDLASTNASWLFCQAMAIKPVVVIQKSKQYDNNLFPILAKLIYIYKKMFLQLFAALKKKKVSS